MKSKVLERHPGAVVEAERYTDSKDIQYYAVFTGPRSHAGRLLMGLGLSEIDAWAAALRDIKRREGK